MRRTLAAILLWALAAQGGAQQGVAQQTGQNAQPASTGDFKIKVRTQLVVETVVVKDKQGKSVEGLAAKDFTITEDGVAQEIRFCESQQLPEQAGVPDQFQPDNVKLYRELPHTQIAPEQQGKLQYQNRRLLALYFDMTAMQPTEQLRALDAAEKFIKTQ